MIADVEKIDWGQVDLMKEMERQRYPVLSGIKAVVGGVVNDYLPMSSRILEIGSGLGFIERLLPERAGEQYFSSDAYYENTRASTQVGINNPVVADAEQLPVASNSLNGVLAVDVLANLQNPLQAIAEAQRVLLPGGAFINIHINAPDCGAILSKHPEYVFFPTNNGLDGVRGVRKDALLRAFPNINPLVKQQVEELVRCKRGVLIDTSQFKPEETWFLLETTKHIIDTISGQHIYYPSVTAYYKQLFEEYISKSGLELVESSYRTSLAITQRRKHHPNYFNCMEMDNGVYTRYHNPLITNGNQVNERVSLQVIVAAKRR